MSPRKLETRDEFLARRRLLAKRPEALAKAREQARRYRELNPEKVRARNAAAYARVSGARSKLKYTYGITPEQYDVMAVQQGGACASCGGPPRSGRPLCVDHCHKTGVVRGLVCDACNVCAGHIESARFKSVVAYLARTQRPGWTVWGNQTDKFAAEAA